MIVFPNAKINIGLSVTEKRPDGFHNINSCFYPVPWCDILELVESNSFSFSQTGIAIPDADNSNLCTDAYHLLAKEYSLPPVSIHLHKNIPAGAGLGGGSSDAAFTLKLLNENFSLNLSVRQLENFASMLGSDCPFFVQNKPAFVEGTGTLFSSIALDLSDMFVAIVCPDVHISTKDAYAQISPQKLEKSWKQVLEQTPVSKWHNDIKNDFESTVAHSYPLIKQIKDQLTNCGAIYASMTGSGSAVYGLFPDKPRIEFDYPVFISILRKFL